ncbi:MoxR family ATPase [Micromonosporaceae bacterium B7E4]
MYTGTGRVVDAEDRDRRWPAPPRWRTFSGGPDEPDPPQDDADLDRRLGRVVVSDHVDGHEADMVNAAIYLRRPLLVTGRPGSGRSSLAYRIAYELRLGRVLRWPVTTNTGLRSGLYDYDAIGRVQAASRVGGPAGRDDRAAQHDDTQLGEYLHLGPLGTALLPYRLPRVLLIDELDQSDIELPQQLRSVFEDGGFEIRELVRVGDRTPQVRVRTADPGRTAVVRSGRVRCHAFPIVVMTCTDERDFPQAFLRQCLRLRLAEADENRLADVVAGHFPDRFDGAGEVIRDYLRRRSGTDTLAMDQLLDAVHLRTSGAFAPADRAEWDRLIEALWHRLSATEPG